VFPFQPGQLILLGPRHLGPRSARFPRESDRLGRECIGELTSRSCWPADLQFHDSPTYGRVYKIRGGPGRQSRLQEVLREDASIGQPPVRYGSGLRESKEEGRESEVRRRRGRRLLIVRLLLLGRFFYGLLRCCFLRCHEHFTPLRCQNVNRCVCGIAEFVQRVQFCFLNLSGRSQPGLHSRKPAPALLDEKDRKLRSLSSKLVSCLSHIFWYGVDLVSSGAGENQPTRCR